MLLGIAGLATTLNAADLASSALTRLDLLLPELTVSLLESCVNPTSQTCSTVSNGRAVIDSIRRGE